MEEKAKESKLVQASRKKLERKLAVEHLQFTSEALEGMSQKIRLSILRHHPEFSLKKRTIALFDENKHTAKTHSKQILQLRKLLEITSRTDLTHLQK